ncbi:hypothetical protein JKA73_11015 [Myxococcus xanthus]|uniref:hypothetical protein n=1 Tax=Myxococcus xanthus TaxID=34 RepID=UPI0019178CEC|nr:hypothetical protein [Myxococcus xanthus]QQR48532.1 hypothetical protein JKA73_11015 [Myxococcus xanthus]
MATALAALLAAELTGLTNKLQAQAEDSKLKGEESKLAAVGHRAAALAEGIVRDIEVTLKPELEAAAADGVLTQAELQQLKATALDRLKTSLGERGLAELQAVLKLFAGSVGAHLSGLIEAALDRMKASRGGPVVALGPLELGASGVNAVLGQPAIQVPSAAVPQTPHG